MVVVKKYGGYVKKVMNGKQQLIIEQEVKDAQNVLVILKHLSQSKQYFSMQRNILKML